MVSLQLLWQMERLLHNSMQGQACNAAQQARQRAILLCERLGKEFLSRGAEDGVSIYLTDQEVETLGSAMKLLGWRAQ